MGDETITLHTPSGAELHINCHGAFTLLVGPVRADGDRRFVIRPDDACGWPFEALIRDRARGEVHSVRVSGGYAGPVEVVAEAAVRDTPGSGTFRGAEREAVTVTYSHLVDREGRVLPVRVDLDVGVVDDTFALEPTIVCLDESFEVEEFQLLSGRPLRFGDSISEAVAIPDWGDGKILPCPRTADFGSYLRGDRKYLSYTAEYGQDMAYGWMAAWGEEGGIGIATLNPELMTMEFCLSRSSQGVGISPTWFRLRTYAETHPFSERTPLALGTILIVPTGGDWHEVADAYRHAYRRIMWSHLPTLGAGSARAARLDVNLHFPIFGSHGETFEPVFTMSFDDVVVRTREFIRKYGVDPGRVLIWLYGFGDRGHDRNNPTQRPIHPAAGGEEGFRRMTAALKAMGVGSIMAYSHAFATQQSRPEYDPAMDVGKGWKMMGAVYHTTLCLSYEATQRLYREQVFQAFAADGVTDVFLDQSTICKGICERSGHDHDTTVLGKLSAHAKGTLRQFQAAHEVFGAETVINIESHNDLGCREAEMSTNGDILAAPHDQPLEPCSDVTQYTFPHVLRMNNHIEARHIPGYLVRGHSCHLSHLQDEKMIRYYMNTRSRLLESAPGYPYGFRDRRGLSWSHGDLDARVFVMPEKGISVVWRGPVGLRDTVVVDLSAHGRRGEWRVPVHVSDADTVGWAVWRDEP